MNYTGLLIALAIAVLAGLAFGLYPQLDLALMAPFYDPATGWIVRGRGWLLVRNMASWIIALIAAPAGIALLSKMIWPHKSTLMPSRAVLLMLLTLALGLVRAAAGGHFISDVVFAGVFMFLLIWIMHGLLYRWRTSLLVSHK